MPDRGADPTNVEVEWQLDALDLRPVERWLADFPRIVPGPTEDSTVVVTIVGQPVTRTVDVYLDTEDWRIGRSGFVLRVRHHADQGEVTLKDRSPAVAGLRRRIELTEPLPAGGLEALGTEGPVGGRLRALAGDAPLGQLIEVRTRRRPHQLSAADELLAELDLDDTIIVVGDDEYPVRMRRVEIEADPRWVDLLTPLVDQLRRDCGLQPAILSKFEVGLLAAGLRVPEPSDLGPTTLGPDPSVGELAYAVLRRNVGVMLAHEAGTRLGEDIEHLHDMRVATRRLRAALALFAGVLPTEAGRLGDELGWLAAELGAVRDLDVQLARLEDWGDEIPGQPAGALTDLARLLDGERDRARENLLAALDSERYDALVSDISALLRAGVGQGSTRRAAAARAPATAVVPGLILARHEAAARAARRARRSGDPADFHRLRIRCKRLRYALEFVAEIYGGRTKPVIRRIVGLQDCLGLLQDSQVAAGRLQELALTENSGLSPATLFAMGSVAERYRRDAERLTAAVPDHLQALRGSAWRKLQKVMDRRRVPAGPPDASSPEPSPAGPSHPDQTGPPLTSGTQVPPGPPSPWSGVTPASPLTDRADDDDSDWEDEYASPLRSVPGVSHDADRPPGAEEPDGRPDPGPSRGSEPQPGRRRKEPVFLPAPPAAARPPAGRPGTVRPVRRSEPPDDDRTRSFDDRP